MAKPFSDEEIRGISAWGRCYNNIEILKMGSEKCFKRFLDTIAADRKTIEALEEKTAMYCPDCKIVYPLSAIPEKPSGILCEKCKGVLRHYLEWRLSNANATIADLKRHIELDTAIKKDHRVKMAADRRELEKYRQGWLVRENEKLKKRIGEVEQEKDEYIGGMAAMNEAMEEKAATIERLRGEMKEMKVQESVFVIHAMIDEALDGKENKDVSHK